ncbi:TetR/AcrR family transcriptional regulator [Spongorhabdus nitratireducens]
MMNKVTTKTRRKPALETLLNSAVTLLAENPGATLSQIASNAGIGRATLHRHFQDREELIAELVRRSLTTSRDVGKPILESDKPSLEKLKELVQVMIPLGDSYHFLMYEWKAMQLPDISDMYQQQMDALTELIETIKEEGHLNPELPVSWVVAVIDTMIYTAWKTVSDGFIARNDASELVINTLNNGVLTTN